MTALVARFALVLGVSSLAAVPAATAAAASSQRGALVRVEVIEQGDAPVRSRVSQTVAWDRTASMQLRVGSHEHRLAITPSEIGRGIALSVDHDRDGTALADDLRVTSAERRIVIEEGETRVVVTVVPVTMHLETH